MQVSNIWLDFSYSLHSSPKDNSMILQVLTLPPFNNRHSLRVDGQSETAHRC